MPKIRVIALLTPEEKEALTTLYKEDSKGWRVRYRSHIILLMNKGRRIGDICKIYDLDEDTVSATIKNWWVIKAIFLTIYF